MASMRAKSRGCPCKRAHGAAAQAAAAVQQQHEVGHELRALADAPVLGLVERQVARFERAGQGDGLLEEQAEAFAGDGVHRAGSVAHQRHAAAENGFEAARCGDAAALQRGRFRAAQAAGPLRESAAARHPGAGADRARSGPRTLLRRPPV